MGERKRMKVSAGRYEGCRLDLYFNKRGERRGKKTDLGKILDTT